MKLRNKCRYAYASALVGTKIGLVDMVVFDVKDFLDGDSSELWTATKELVVNKLPGITSVVGNDD